MNSPKGHHHSVALHNVDVRLSFDRIKSPLCVAWLQTAPALKLSAWLPSAVETGLRVESGRPPFEAVLDVRAEQQTDARTGMAEQGRLTVRLRAVLNPVATPLLIRLLKTEARPLTCHEWVDFAELGLRSMATGGETGLVEPRRSRTRQGGLAVASHPSGPKPAAHEIAAPVSQPSNAPSAAAGLASMFDANQMARLIGMDLSDLDGTQTGLSQ